MDISSAGQTRCPSCYRMLVLRSGPAITPHFAHRPRQSCRNRPGRSGVVPPRLEQLTLFDLEIVALREPPPWAHPDDATALPPAVPIAPTAPVRRPVRR